MRYQDHEGIRFAVVGGILFSIVLGLFMVPFRMPPMARHIGTHFILIRTPPLPCPDEMLKNCDPPTLDCVAQRQEDMMSVERETKIVVSCTCTERPR